MYICTLENHIFWKIYGNLKFFIYLFNFKTYRGPKAFQRHFSEWRHAHGMRCLGIPNTAHFANVTEIEDALACKLTFSSDIIIKFLSFLSKISKKNSFLRT